MIPFEEFKIPKPQLYKCNKRTYDDNIYCFDIETISLFKIDGTWQPFDYSRDNEYYKDVDKACCPYLWQFGANGKVYFGREFLDFDKVLKKLYHPRITKFCYVHNLSYEMQFICDILDKNHWHISELCARNVRQPIQFKIDEVNIIFRCSYMLTNLSLEKSAEKYTTLKKAVGELDYNIAYSPLSKLPDTAYHYGETDITTLTAIIEYFKREYKHVKSIPLTQTGEVRYALKQHLDKFYYQKQWALVPDERMYCALMSAFAGGITHANLLYAGRVIEDVWSYDECSEYPYCLLFEYPSEPFREIDIDEIEECKDTHCLLYDIKLKNVRATKHNHYLPFSKLTNVKKDKGHRLVLDNGRVVKCWECELVCTDNDLDCIRSCYTFDIEYNHVWASYKCRLDKRIIDFILERYSAKTELKGVEDKYDFYMKMKQQLNSIYGMSCTNPLKTGITLDNNYEWHSTALWDLVDDGNGNMIPFITKKLNDMRHSYSTLFYYAVGVWCTSYARKNIWSVIMQLDSEVIYYDTDSIKGVGTRVKDVVDNYNNKVLERLHGLASELKIDFNKLAPYDINGIRHPLGVFECETDKGNYKELITLGAKKYCVRDYKGNLHMTVSGVRKGAVGALHDDIRNFKDGTVFGYKDADKLTHSYIDDQEPFYYTDVDGNSYYCQQRHSIVLQPTTYTLGLTDEYELLVDSYYGIVEHSI